MFDAHVDAVFDSRARESVRNLRSSKIREVANAGMGAKDVLPFWFGEPDKPTSEAVREVAIKSLRDGETFYVQTLGLPDLRERIAEYVSELRGPRSVGNIAVTSSGVSSLMLAVQAIIEKDDSVVAVTPIWPNLVEMPKILGAHVTTVSLDFHRNGWQLDLDKLLQALVPGTKALLLNSPNNPTGWVISQAERDAILAHCRKHGIWIIADDVYERYYFAGRSAPSFLDKADPDERVISCNSFSKTWLMTGWRVGWAVVPQTILSDFSKLIEFSSTCTPGFVQRAAVHALTHGEQDIARTVERLQNARDHLAAGLATIPGVYAGPPASGAMYSFFQVEGMRDSLAFAKQLVSEAGLGLAPGIAFGPEGEGYLRWCFASSHERLDEGIARLKKYLESAPRLG